MKRSYKPILRTEEEKQNYFCNLIKQINIREYKEQYLNDLESFMTTHEEFRQILMFRRKKKCQKTIKNL